MTVWIYVDTNKQVDDKDHLKAFSRKPSTSSVAKCSRDHTNVGWRFVCTACGFAGSVNITPNWHDRKRGRAPFQVGWRP
jgi:hypothetical protein